MVYVHVRACGAVHVQRLEALRGHCAACEPMLRPQPSLDKAHETRLDVVVLCDSAVRTDSRIG